MGPDHAAKVKRVLEELRALIVQGPR
jgi:hypothetical protein